MTDSEKDMRNAIMSFTLGKAHGSVMMLLNQNDIHELKKGLIELNRYLTEQMGILFLKTNPNVDVNNPNDQQET